MSFDVSQMSEFKAQTYFYFFNVATPYSILQTGANFISDSIIKSEKSGKLKNFLLKIIKLEYVFYIFNRILMEINKVSVQE